MTYRRDVPQVGPAGTDDAGGQENDKDEQGHPITDPLQSLVRVRDCREIETGKYVPIHYVFYVELNGCHDDPEDVPYQGGDEC